MISARLSGRPYKPPVNMDIRQLESLLAVLDASTMTQAAENLHLSTAAVSLQLTSLASELGVELFVRSGRTLTPTPAARRLAEHARAVNLRLRQSKRSFPAALVLIPVPFISLREQQR